MTYNDIREFEKLKVKFEDAIYDIVDKKIEIETGDSFDGDIKAFYYGDDDEAGCKVIQVVLPGKPTCNCCETDDIYHDIPEHYLYTDGWEQECLDVYNLKQKKKQKDIALQRIKALDMTNQEERELYEKLKNKFK